jgi:hypothetical protein
LIAAGLADGSRYYCLHGLVAAEAKKPGLDESAAKDLLRRAEVVVGAVSARHWETGGHGALSRPHVCSSSSATTRAAGIVPVWLEADGSPVGNGDGRIWSDLAVLRTTGLPPAGAGREHDHVRVAVFLAK